MRPKRLIEAAIGRVDGIAVTDHNTIEAVEKVAAEAPSDFIVIPGEEIDTQSGQIIGLFLDSKIEPWQSATSVIDEIHRQEGIAFTPHPFDSFREGLVDIEQYTAQLDAIETINSRCVREDFNDQATTFARNYGLSEFGGSDAHFPNEVGNASTFVDIDANETSIAAVEEALRRGRTEPDGGRGSLLNHAGTKAVKLLDNLR